MGRSASREFLHPTFFAVGLVVALASVRWGRPGFEVWRARLDPAPGQVKEAIEDPLAVGPEAVVLVTRW